MQASVVEDPATIGEIADEWMSLWHADPKATPFHTPDYAAAAWDTELGADRSFLSVQMRRDGNLAGLANLTREPDGTIRFLGNPNVTDYLGPVAALEDRGAVADLLVRTLAQIEDWRSADLWCLADDSGWVEAFEEAARTGGLATQRSPLDVCPRISLAGDFDQYLASLGSKLRHEIRRKARRLEREAGAFAVRLTDQGSLEGDLQTFYTMHRRSDGPKGHFLYEEMAALFSRIAAAFLARGWLRLSWLEVDGEPWAGVFSIATRGTWSVYNSVFDHTKRDLGPGMVLMGETIRLAAEEGAHTFDLLRGDEPYKYRFGAVDAALSRLVLTREGSEAPAALAAVKGDV